MRLNKLQTCVCHVRWMLCTENSHRDPTVQNCHMEEVKKQKVLRGCVYTGCPLQIMKSHLRDFSGEKK